MANCLANYSNCRSFHGNSEELTKVPLMAAGGHTQVTCSLYPSNFVFFADQEHSQPFYLFISAAIGVLAVVWDTPFGCLLCDGTILYY